MGTPGLHLVLTLEAKIGHFSGHEDMVGAHGPDSNFMTFNQHTTEVSERLHVNIPKVRYSDMGNKAE